MNDFHGGAYTDIYMLTMIGGLLEYKKASTDDTIILASGDMFQGTALSNYYYGLPVLESMNTIGFDAMTLGNHEFDWDISEIAKYADGNPSNGEADFPILAANIVYEDTGEPLPWTTPYTIIVINGVKVGIIGVIGDVINSISASRVENIEFLDAVNTVYDYSEILRTEADCDVVLVSIHDYGTDILDQIAAFTGDHLVDAVFCGHSHTSVASYINRTGTRLPYVQASNNSSSLFNKITLVFDRSQGKVVSADARIYSESQLSLSSLDVETVLDIFADDPDYQAFVTEVLTTSYGEYEDWELAPWGSSVIRDYVGLDFGMLNSGGFRNPMPSGTVTMGDLVTIYPFDNYIKTCLLTGKQLTDFYKKVKDSHYDVVFDDQVSFNSTTGVLYKDGVPVVLDQYYSVGAVDYVFDKTSYAFLDGEDITTTTFLIRNLLAQDLRNHVSGFDPAGGTEYVAMIPVAYFSDYFELKNQFYVI